MTQNIIGNNRHKIFRKMIKFGFLKQRFYSSVFKFSQFKGGIFLHLKSAVFSCQTVSHYIQRLKVEMCASYITTFNKQFTCCNIQLSGDKKTINFGF
jgi:hypothetical protein